MGATPLPYRGRMPVFYYLSEEEAADVCWYLLSYPPYQWATLDAAVAPAQRVPNPSQSDPPRLVGEMSFAGGSERGEVAAANGSTDREVMSFAILAGMLAAFLLAGGFIFTVRECMRLSAQGRHRRLPPLAARVGASNDAGRPEDDRLVA